MMEYAELGVNLDLKNYYYNYSVKKNILAIKYKFIVIIRFILL